MIRISKILITNFFLVIFPIFSFGQVPIQYYDFENNSSRSTTSELTPELIINSISGSTVSSVGGSLSQTAGNPNTGSAVQRSGWNSNGATDPSISASAYIQFSINTDGFSGISIAVDVLSSATLQGPTGKINLLYSGDGGISFSASNSQTLPTVVAGFTTLSWDLSSTTALDNNSNIVIRLYAYPEATGLGTTAFDNLTIYAKTITKTKTLGNYQTIASATTSTLPTFGSFTINGSGITAALSSNLKLNGTLTLTTGIFSTGSYAVQIVSGGTISGGSSSSYISGSLAQYYSADAFKSFPIGSATAYRPVIVLIASSTGTGLITVKQTDAAPTYASKPATIDKLSNIRFWTITKEASLTVPNSTIRLTWGSDDGITDVSNVTVVFGTNGGVWSVEDNSTAPSGNSSSGTVGGAYTYGLPSDVTFGNKNGGSNPLPVEITEFKVESTDHGVILTWETATEVNNYGFEILRFAQNDNSDWIKVGFVQGHGNSNSSKEYSFEDKNPQAGKLQYRLKQIDFDGSYKYSDIIELQIDSPSEIVLHQNYPNPFNPTTTIKYEIPKSSFVKLRIFDLLGREISTLVNQVQNAGYHEISFNGKDLSSGIYIYQIHAGEFSQIKKMLLMK